jgi:hypothetical protein
VSITFFKKLDLLDGFKFDLTQSGLDIRTPTGLIEVRANQAQVYMNAYKE